jgi:hypothetical protein
MRAKIFILALWFAILAPPARSAEIAATEYELKAAFIFNFTQFVDWPTNAFDSSADPITIGIVGPDPFGPAIDKIVEGESVRGRKLKVERYPRPADVKTNCQILFISKTLAAVWPDLLRALRDKPILTVSDMDRFTARGGMIQLVTERNLVRMRINADAAKRADISISSKLLRLADSGPRDGGSAP